MTNKKAKAIKSEVASYQGLVRKPRPRAVVFSDKTKYNRKRMKQQFCRYETE